MRFDGIKPSLTIQKMYVPLSPREKNDGVPAFKVFTVIILLSAVGVLMVMASQMYNQMNMLVEFNRKMTTNTFLMCNMTKDITMQNVNCLL